MHKFVRHLITEWRRLGLPFSGETIIVAVSGGADSVSLVLAIHDLVQRKKLGHRFVVAHLDHGLRKESGEDAAFVRELAGELGFEFRTEKAELRGRGNVEEKARNARYEFLMQVGEARGAYAVLTAHTKNDQAETFLMNLIRGSGLDGLRAMPSIRRLGKGNILLVRPLLGWASRDDTEGFCRERGIRFREDAMNEDIAFTRVKLRKLVLPLLREINPKIVDSLARTAGLIISENSGDILDHSSDLSVKELNALESAGLRKRLREWIRSVRGDLRGLELKHFEAIERLIRSRKSGRLAELPGGWGAVKTAGRLQLMQIKVEKSPPDN